MVKVNYSFCWHGLLLFQSVPKQFVGVRLNRETEVLSVSAALQMAQVGVITNGFGTTKLPCTPLLGFRLRWCWHNVTEKPRMSGEYRTSYESLMMKTREEADKQSTDGSFTPSSSTQLATNPLPDSVINLMIHNIPPVKASTKLRSNNLHYFNAGKLSIKRRM